MGQLRSYAPFSNTRWTLIRALCDQDDAERGAAREQLASQYLAPVYSYVRSKGHSREDATDIAQSFFANVVYQRDLFERAERGVGRLRALLKTAVDKHIIDLSRRQKQRREREVPTNVLETEEGGFLELQGQSPDDVFEKSWAASVVQEATRRCHERLIEAGQEKSFDVFARWFGIRLSGNQGKRLTAAQLAAEFGLPSADQVYSMTHRVKLRLREAIREVLREQVGSESELNEDLQHLGQVIGLPL